MSDPSSGVLTNGSTMSSPERSDGVRSDGDAPRGSAPPPPPPAPGPGNVRVTKEQVKATSKAYRNDVWARRWAYARSLDRRYFWYAGLLAAIPLVYLGCQEYQQGQERLAQITASARQPVQVAEESDVPAPVEGIPNPLQPLALSSEAVWVLGAEYKYNDKREPVGFTDLPPIRSAAVITKLIEDVDLCKVFVSLGPTAEVVVTFEPTAGSYPLIDPNSEQCAAPVFVPTPQDPVPSTTTAVAS